MYFVKLVERYAALNGEFAYALLFRSYFADKCIQAPARMASFFFSLFFTKAVILKKRSVYNTLQAVIYQQTGTSC